MVRVTEIKLVDRLLLVGAPGIGKTEIIKQLAEEEAKKLGKEFIDLREASNEVLHKVLENPSKYYVYYRIIAPHIFPEDLGIPKMTGANGKDYIEFLPPLVLKVLSMPEVHGVLFIDEITNVQRDDQLSMMYSLILEKEASWILKLSRNIKIVLAGNPPEWSEITRPLPKPLRNRVSIVFVNPPTVDEWIRYMNVRHNDKWEKLVGAYLKLYPEDLLKAPSEDDFTAYPTPRSWTNLALLLKDYTDYRSDFVEELVIGNLGKEVGSKLLALLRTNVDVEKVLEDIKTKPEAFNELGLNAKILVLNALAQRDEKVIANEYDKFIEYLGKSNREMLMIFLLFMDRKKRTSIMMYKIKVIKEVISEIAKYF